MEHGGFMDTIFGTSHDITAAQECARAALIFVYGLVMLRLSGRRTFAQWSALDVVMTIVIGSALSRTMTASAPLVGTLSAVAVLVFLHIAVSYAIARSDVLSRIVEGRSVVLTRHGAVDQTVRLKHKISNSDLAEAMRSAGLNGLDAISSVDRLELEPSGKISVVKKQE
jgi:uncharacterized membrane protein YcaP (DUF421 family)